MGANHARVAMGLRDAAVTAIFDPDAERAKVLADAVGATAVDSASAAIDAADAVVIAAPNSEHLALGLACINAQTPVLIKKPIAVTLREADALVEAAKANNVL